MEITDGVDYDSDKTLTASEGEETDEEIQTSLYYTKCAGPLTYAEIVKWGMPNYCGGVTQSQGTDEDATSLFCIENILGKMEAICCCFWQW